MTEGETIRQKAEALDGAAHAREHEGHTRGVELLAERLATAERNYFDVGKRMELLEAAVRQLEEGRTIQAGTILSHSRRLDGLEKASLARQERAFAGEEGPEFGPEPERRSGLSLLEITEAYELRDLSGVDGLVVTSRREVWGKS